MTTVSDPETRETEAEAAVRPDTTNADRTARADRVVRRGPRDAEGLAAVDVVPRADRPRATEPRSSGPRPTGPRVTGPRVTGPGRKERAYQQRIADAERELELARLLERGANRRLDRLETEVRDARQLERRLLVALGALQEQNRALRAQNAELLGDRARDDGRRLGRSS